ncbi:MAG: flagellar basal body rod protein FlgB [Motiliproteus sp.]|nr:flagellar basal body rod protein FlgB [Motiliproteus sp.]MCW9051982.1 flagellar basal body rod protein FlgB [Motiliproteus sp.]
MAISFDSALGIHQQAMLVRTQRAEVLANNIANADTPNYKARDLDFKAILAGQSDTQQSLAMAATKSGHSGGIIEPDFAADLMYRVPLQPSIDGNTVDQQMEQSEYARNALDFQTSFTFLNRKFTGLTKAIKGE